jgi:hypothetical protein
MTQIEFDPELSANEATILESIAGLVITGTTVNLEDGVTFNAVCGEIIDALWGVTRKSVNMKPVED